VRADLDDLVTALYVTIDEQLAPRCGPGRRPALSDAELVCLAVAQVLLGCHSERRWLRFARARLGHLVPYLPGQAGYNKRLRAAAGLVAWAIRCLAVRERGWREPLRLLDSTPLPCAASRQTVQRSQLAGLAGYGYCPAHSRWFWGLRLYLLTTGDGLPLNWCLATPKLGEREVAEDLLADTPPPWLAGATVYTDKGLAGRAFERHVGELGAVVLRPDRADEPRRYGSLGRIRQWVESVIDTLKDQLGLEQHGGRTPAGVFVRVAQRLLALAAVLWFEHCWLGQPGRHLTAYDH
jgi:hypothetical protein